MVPGCVMHSYKLCTVWLAWSSLMFSCNSVNKPTSLRASDGSQTHFHLIKENTLKRAEPTVSSASLKDLEIDSLSGQNTFIFTRGRSLTHVTTETVQDTPEELTQKLYDTVKRKIVRFPNTANAVVLHSWAANILQANQEPTASMMSLYAKEAMESMISLYTIGNENPQGVSYTQVQIPPGYSPGQMFTAQVGGKMLPIRVPFDKRPGDFIMLPLPKEPSVEPTPSSPTQYPPSSQYSPSSQYPPSLSTPSQYPPSSSAPSHYAEVQNPLMPREAPTEQLGKLLSDFRGFPPNSRSSTPDYQLNAFEHQTYLDIEHEEDKSKMPEDLEYKNMVEKGLLINFQQKETGPPQQYSVQIPAGLAPGQSFMVPVGDTSLPLTVPYDKKAGDSMVFFYPPASTHESNPTTGAPATSDARWPSALSSSSAPSTYFNYQSNVATHSNQYRAALNSEQLGIAQELQVVDAEELRQKLAGAREQALAKALGQQEDLASAAPIAPFLEVFPSTVEVPPSPPSISVPPPPVSFPDTVAYEPSSSSPAIEYAYEPSNSIPSLQYAYEPSNFPPAFQSAYETANYFPADQDVLEEEVAIAPLPEVYSSTPSVSFPPPPVSLPSSGTETVANNPNSLPSVQYMQETSAANFDETAASSPNQFQVQILQDDFQQEDLMEMSFQHPQPKEPTNIKSEAPALQSIIPPVPPSALPATSASVPAPLQSLSGASVSQAQTKFLKVTIPEGKMPGDTFTINTASAGKITVTVPMDKKPGESMAVPVTPKASASAEQTEIPPPAPLPSPVLRSPDPQFTITYISDETPQEAPKEQTKSSGNLITYISDEQTLTTEIAKPTMPQKDVLEEPTLPSSNSWYDQLVAEVDTDVKGAVQVYPVEIQVPDVVVPVQVSQVDILQADAVAVDVTFSQAEAVAVPVSVPIEAQPSVPAVSVISEPLPQIQDSSSPPVYVNVEEESDLAEELLLHPNKAKKLGIIDDLTQETPLKQFSVLIPRGIMPGQTFDVDIIDGQSITLTAPDDKVAGDVLTFSVPVEQSSDQELNVSNFKPQFHQQTIEIPEGVDQGDQFTLDVDGHLATIQVPYDGKPGDSITIFMLPKPQSQTFKNKLIQIPDGLMPGMSFDMKIDAKKFTVTVPIDKQGGDPLSIAIPQEVEEEEPEPEIVMIAPEHVHFNLEEEESEPEPEVEVIGPEHVHFDQESQNSMVTEVNDEVFDQPQQKEVQIVPAQFAVTIPDGMVPGQTLTMQINGNTISLTIPPGKGPGDSMMFSLPVSGSETKKDIIEPLEAPETTTPDTTENTEQHLMQDVTEQVVEGGGQDSTPNTEQHSEQDVPQYTVQIPEWVLPGQAFTVNINDQSVTITCPLNKNPGDLMTFSLPPSPVEEEEARSQETKELNEAKIETVILPDASSSQQTIQETIPEDAPQYTVQIPSWVVPGQSFTVNINDQTISLTCPVDQGPGDLMTFSLPAETQPTGTEGIEQPTASIPPTTEQPASSQETAPQDEPQYRVQIPAWIVSGQSFTVNINDEPISLTCPVDKGPGDFMTFSLPAQAQPATGAEDIKKPAPPISSETGAEAIKKPAPPSSFDSEQLAISQGTEDIKKPAPPSSSGIEQLQSSSQQSEMQPPQQYTVAIPEGFVPGQSFTVTIAGKPVTLTVPLDKHSGDTMIFSVPDEAAQNQSEEPVAPQFTVQIPDGLVVGQSFTVNVGGKPVTLNVPPEKHAGDFMTFSLPAVDEKKDSEVPAPQQFSARIPEGLSAGQSFKVQIEGKVLTLTVPVDKGPGDAMVFSLPAETPRPTPLPTPIPVTSAPTQKPTMLPTLPPTPLPKLDCQFIGGKLKCGEAPAPTSPPVVERPPAPEGPLIPSHPLLSVPSRASAPSQGEGNVVYVPESAELNDYKVYIPDGLLPGQSFVVDVDGMFVTLTVPDNADHKPGYLMFDLPDGAGSFQPPKNSVTFVPSSAASNPVQVPSAVISGATKVQSSPAASSSVVSSGATFVPSAAISNPSIVPSSAVGSSATFVQSSPVSSASIRTSPSVGSGATFVPASAATIPSIVPSSAVSSGATFVKSSAAIQNDATSVPSEADVQKQKDDDDFEKMLLAKTIQSQKDEDVPENEEDIPKNEEDVPEIENSVPENKEEPLASPVSSEPASGSSLKGAVVSGTSASSSSASPAKVLSGSLVSGTLVSSGSITGASVQATAKSPSQASSSTLQGALVSSGAVKQGTLVSSGATPGVVVSSSSGIQGAVTTSGTMLQGKTVTGAPAKPSTIISGGSVVPASSTTQATVISSGIISGGSSVTAGTVIHGALVSTGTVQGSAQSKVVGASVTPAQESAVTEAPAQESAVTEETDESATSLTEELSEGVDMLHALRDNTRTVKPRTGHAAEKEEEKEEETQGVAFTPAAGGDDETQTTVAHPAAVAVVGSLRGAAAGPVSAVAAASPRGLLTTLLEEDNSQIEEEMAKQQESEDLFDKLLQNTVATDSEPAYENAKPVSVSVQPAAVTVVGATKAAVSAVATANSVIVGAAPVVAVATTKATQSEEIETAHVQPATVAAVTSPASSTEVHPAAVAVVAKASGPEHVQPAVVSVTAVTKPAATVSAQPAAVAKVSDGSVAVAPVAVASTSIKQDASPVQPQPFEDPIPWTKPAASVENADSTESAPLQVDNVNCGVFQGKLRCVPN